MTPLLANLSKIDDSTRFKVFEDLEKDIDWKIEKMGHDGEQGEIWVCPDICTYDRRSTFAEI